MKDFLVTLGSLLKRYIVWQVRGILPLLIIAGIVASVIVAPAVSSALGQGRVLWTAAEMAATMDKAYDKLPLIPLIPDGEVKDLNTEDYGGSFQCWGIKTNSELLCKFTLEVLPYYYYEGLHGENDAVWPASIAFIPGDGQYHFHILGRASCAGHYAILNYRSQNYASPWNDATSILATLVHELGHVQGVCGEPVGYMEASNQVLTFEILAAMANHGNHYAVRPLVKELRDSSLSYVEAELIDTPLYPVFKLWKHLTINTTFEERARVAKSRRYWANKQDELEYIIRSYGAVPYTLYASTVSSPPYITPKLQLIEWGQTLVLDDLAYFINNLDKHVNSVLESK